MSTKKKSPPNADTDPDADAEVADAGKKAGKNKAKQAKKKTTKKDKQPSKLAPMLMRMLRAAPSIGLVLLMSVSAFFAWKALELGKNEGEVSFASGRYASIDIDSGDIHGHLLPPADAVPTSLIPDQQPDVSNPELAIPTIAVPEGDVQLRKAPNMSLVEKKNDVLLPKKSADGLAAWDYYSRPHTPTKGAKPISVIVTGLGINSDLSLAVAKLPPAVSLSISPYVQNPNSWVKSMRIQGHECYLDLPLELSNYPLSDPGPYALQPSIMPAENMTRFEELLGKAVGYVGFVVPADEVFFAAQEDFILPVASELEKRGLSLIFSQAKERPALAEILEQEETVYLQSHVFIRYGSDAVDIRQQLGAAEAVSIQSGHSLVVIEASPVAVQELEKWLGKLRSNGFQLVPASALAREQFS